MLRTKKSSTRNKRDTPSSRIHHRSSPVKKQLTTTHNRHIATKVLKKRRNVAVVSIGQANIHTTSSSPKSSFTSFGSSNQHNIQNKRKIVTDIMNTLLKNHNSCSHPILNMSSIRALSTSTQTLSRHRAVYRAAPLHTSKRTFINPGASPFDTFQQFINPFGPRRRGRKGTPFTLDGAIPIQYKIRQAALIAGAAVCLVGVSIVAFKALLLGIRVGLTYLAIRWLRDKGVQWHLAKGNMSAAMAWATWGESHKNDSTLHYIAWAANPINWAIQLRRRISAHHRDQIRLRHLYNQVIEHLEEDPRLVNMFGSDYVIGDLSPEGIYTWSGVDEDTQYSGYACIPIYKRRTVIDVDISSSNRRHKSRGPGTLHGKRYKDDDIDSEESDEEANARQAKKRAEQTFDEFYSKQNLDDVGYDYKYYQNQPPLSKATDGDWEDEEVRKRIAFMEHAGKRNRIKHLDFSTLRHHWLHSATQYADKTSEDVLRPKVDRNLEEAGLVYVFYSDPQFEKQAAEAGTSIAKNIGVAMGLFGDGPYQIERVSVYVPNSTSSPTTLYSSTHHINWSRSVGVRKDRSFTTHMKEVTGEQAEPIITTSSNDPLDAQYDDPNAPRIIEAEFVENDPPQSSTKNRRF